MCAQPTFIADLYSLPILFYKGRDRWVTPFRIGRRISKRDTRGIRLNLQGNKQEY